MADQQQQQADPNAGREEVSELREIQEFLRKHGTPILLAVIIAAVVSFGVVTYRNHRQGEADLASVALAAAVSGEDYERIVDTHASTPSAPVALLGLASRHFHEGEYDEARAAYERFRGEYPEHPMYLATDICLAQIVQAEGDSAGALQLFEAFLNAHPDSYLAPVAEIGRGRCLQQQGRLNEAKTAYEDLIAANPESPWTGLAETRLGIVRMSIRAVENPLPAVAQIEPASEEPLVPSVLSPVDGDSATNDGPVAAEG